MKKIILIILIITFSSCATKNELSYSDVLVLQNKFNELLNCGNKNLLSEKYKESIVCFNAATELSSENSEVVFNTDDLDYFYNATYKAIQLKKEMNYKKKMNKIYMLKLKIEKLKNFVLWENRKNTIKLKSDVENKFNKLLNCGVKMFLKDKIKESLECLKAASDVAVKNPRIKTVDLFTYSSAVGSTIAFKEWIESIKKKYLKKEMKLERLKRALSKILNKKPQRLLNK
ncbi:MAG: hypothetical protein GY760_29655 [Deltaproteobacteria bacterium]|nr:hypothetical protein [Deltaproteobacteria bacterium]